MTLPSPNQSLPCLDDNYQLLVESQQRLAFLVESSNDAIIGKDLNSIITTWNKGAEKIFGYTASEMLGTSITRLIPPERLEEETLILSKIRSGESVEHFETVRRTKSGRLISVSVTASPIKDAQGKVVGASKVARDITEQKEARESLRRQAALFDQMYDAAIVWEWEGPITFWNRGAEQLYGFAREAAIGQVSHKLLQTTLPGGVDSFVKALHSSGHWEGELNHITHNGRHITVESRMILVRESGRSCVLEANRDVTERKKAEEEAASALRKLAEIKAALDEHAIVAITDEKGKISYVNDKFCAISKYSREELLGQDHRIINSGHHSKQFIRGLWETIRNGRVWKGEIKNKAKDGTFYWVDTTIVPYLGEDGKPQQYIAIRADITGRKQADEKTAEALRELNDVRSALDEHAIVAITNPAGRIIYVNDKFCAISKYSRDELIGQDHRIINSGFHPKPFIRGLWKTIGSGRVWKGEIKNRAKDGTFYWVATTIVPYLGTDGKPVQYIAIRADITERKQAEEALQKAQNELREHASNLEAAVAERTAQLVAANKELEAFSYSVSHDLRAPLRAIDGFSKAVLEDYGSVVPEECRHDLQTVRRSTQRMGRLIDDLLSFSRTGRAALKKTTIKTAALVAGVLKDQKAFNKGRKIEFKIQDLPECLGDRALLEQVWVNLVSNALKYSAKRDVSIIEIGFTQHSGRNAFCVRDNGVGFDMAYAHKLFGVFQRLHRAEDYEGTGVGLAIVHRIIHRHGGTIWAESAEDRGAAFYFTLGETCKA